MEKPEKKYRGYVFWIKDEELAAEVKILEPGRKRFEILEELIRLGLSVFRAKNGAGSGKQQ